VSNESLSIDDLRAIAEMLADVLAERGVVASEPQRPQRVLTAADVAEILDRDRRWVYGHAEELGAFRYGDGPRGRLGFDREVTERWKRERQLAARRGRAPRRGRPPKTLALTGRASLLPFEA
jgi:hypothetical protein